MIDTRERLSQDWGQRGDKVSASPPIFLSLKEGIENLPTFYTQQIPGTAAPVCLVSELLWSSRQREESNEAWKRESSFWKQLQLLEITGASLNRAAEFLLRVTGSVGENHVGQCLGQLHLKYGEWMGRQWKWKPSDQLGSSCHNLG